MPSYNSTARVPFSKGGKVGQKKSPVKRIILWKGKAKNWPGAKKAAEQTRNKKAEGGWITKKKKQGYKDREDESLGMRTGKESGKKQSMKDRRDESYGKWGTRPNQRINRAKGGKAKKKKYKRHGMEFDKPLGPKGTFSSDNPPKRMEVAKGGKAKKNWIQGVNKSIKKRGTKGVCTGKKFGSASCPAGSKRYNLAKTFKKMARAKHASGGLVRFI